MARKPYAITSGQIDELVKLLEEGVSERMSIQAVGIAASTFSVWMNGDKPQHRAFADAVTRARARGAINLHRQAREGGKGSHGAMFILERRFREEYGAHQKIEHSGPDGGAIVGEIRNMSTEELAKLAAQRQTPD